MKLNRVGLGAGVLLVGMAMAACSSSGSSSGNSSSASSGGSATSSATSSSSSSSGGSIDCQGAAPLKVDGSTAQANAIAAWEKAYSAACGSSNAWTYGGGGSGQGVTDFTGNKVDFAGSDAALDPSKGEVTAANKACGSPALDLPMVTGPIAVSYKLSGVSSLTLTPTLIAKIFTGKITTWNDPEIKAENPGVNLPSAKITVFFRSDQSGTTENFEKYLSATAPSIYTATPSKTWVGTGQGKTGSAGVQQALSSTNDSIAYVEWSYTGGLTNAKIDNGGGAVALTAETAGKAVAAAQLAPNSNQGDLTLKLDYATKTAGAYPIILVTYELVCSKYSSATTAAAVKSFLTYTSSSAGQSILPGIGSAPLPSSIQSKVQAAVASITG